MDTHVNEKGQKGTNNQGTSETTPLWSIMTSTQMRERELRLR